MKNDALDQTILRLSRVRLLRELSDLLDQSRRGVVLEDAWGTIHRLLDSLPFDTATYAVACRRLASIRGYLRADELGAALYEARLLRPLVLNG